MTCGTDYDWSLVAGDDSTRVFEYQDSNGDPIDLTGYTATLLYDVGVIGATIPATVDGVAGTVTAKLPDTVTDTFRGNGIFRLRIVAPGGDKLTLVAGRLMMKL